MRHVPFTDVDLKVATAVIVDGAGTFIPMNINAGLYNEEFMTWECESIFTCNHPMRLKLYKHPRR